MTDCVFCRVLAGDLPGSFVHREELCAAFMDIQPIHPGHTLVAPVAHVQSLSDLDPETASRLIRVAQRIAAAQRHAVECEGVNLLVADGEVAGQEVPHLHLHVLPRSAGDGFGFRFPPGYPSPVKRKALDAAAALIRDGMKRQG